MKLHITSGGIAGDILRKTGVPGEVFVWHDILYEGPRNPGWPDEPTLHERARFLSEATGGGLTTQETFATLGKQYTKLREAGKYDSLVLWFDACLFDQSMLVHLLACIDARSIGDAQLVCVDAFPGIVPFDGLGQLSPSQMASLFNERQPVTGEQLLFAGRVDAAFALQDRGAFIELSRWDKAPLPWVPPAAARWLEELPDEVTDLGRLEELALEAVRSGCRTPSDILAYVAGRDTHPRYWGDTTLRAKINGLAKRTPPLVTIEGPAPLLPQWDGEDELPSFRVHPL